MIEVMFAIRKDGFKDHPVIPEGLDLVDEDDQFTHMLPLDDEYNTEDILSKIWREREGGKSSWLCYCLCRNECVYGIANVCLYSLRRV